MRMQQLRLLQQQPLQQLLLQQQTATLPLHAAAAAAAAAIQAVAAEAAVKEAESATEGATAAGLRGTPPSGPIVTLCCCCCCCCSSKTAAATAAAAAAVKASTTRASAGVACRSVTSSRRSAVYGRVFRCPSAAATATAAAAAAAARGKAAAAMAAAAEDAAAEGRAFAELEELLSQEEFDQAYKAASQLPVSVEQTHAVVYSSLQTRRWAEARAAIRKLRQHLQQQQQKSPTAAAAAAAAAGDFGLEEAYCFYRLNNPQKALQLLSELQQQKLRPQDEAAATHLHAQVLHRCGRYREAFEIYARLLAASSKQDKEILLLRLLLLRHQLLLSCCLAQCARTRSTAQFGAAVAAAADLLVSNYLACMTCMLQTEAASCSSSSSSSRSKEKPHPAAVSAALQNDCSSSGTFELPFNAACLAMQQGDLDTAESLLHRSIAEEGVSLADVMSCLENGRAGELAGLLVQQAVLQQQQGHAAAAERVYAMLQSAIEQQQQQRQQQQQHEQQQQQQQLDVGVAAVAMTNQSVLSLKRRQRLEGDLEERLRRMGPLDLLQHKLTKPQALGIGVVRCLGLLQAGRTEEALRVVSSLSSRLGGFVGLERLKATIQFVSGKLSKAEQTLRCLLETSIPEQQSLDSPRLDLQLALGALLLQKGDRPQASALLREVQQQLLKLAQHKRTSSTSSSSSSSSSSSRYLTLLGAAFELQQQADGIDGVFESLQLQTALEGVQGLAAVSASVDFSLAAAALAASVGRWEFAAAQSEQALQRLQQQQQQQQQERDGEAAATAELRALVSLAEALCRCDLEKAGVYVQRLMRFIPQSVSLLDADEIELRSLPATRSRKAAAAAAAAAAASGAGGVVKATKKRRRKKIRYPKGFDPTKPQLPPDPERWLPKYERSATAHTYSSSSSSNSSSSSGSSSSSSSSSSHNKAERVLRLQELIQEDAEETERNPKRRGTGSPDPRYKQG
ncbi:hypothetical protein Emag_007636 [Eimeria magna]